MTLAPSGDNYLDCAANAARQSFGALQTVRHKTGLATVSHLHFIQVGWQTAGSLEQPPPVLALCAASADSALSSRCSSPLCGSLESSASAPPARPATNRPTVTALTTPLGKNRLRSRNLRKDEQHRARPIRAPALGNRPQHTGKPRKGKRPPSPLTHSPCSCRPKPAGKIKSGSSGLQQDLLGSGWGTGQLLIETPRFLGPWMPRPEALGQDGQRLLRGLRGLRQLQHGLHLRELA